MSAIPIYEGQDFYVPAFKVILDDKEVKEDVVREITQVSYKDTLKGYDTFDITISNWDAEKRQFKYSESDVFDPGKVLELHMGYYGGKFERMIKGEITSLQPSYPAGGQPTLKVSGKNMLHYFQDKQETETYTDVTDSEIARRIGQRLKIDVETDKAAEKKENKYEYVLQENKYNVLFLMERARDNGYDLIVNDGSKDKKEIEKLYFGPSINLLKTQDYELEYGRSLIQFQPTLNVTNQVAEVTVSSWDTKHKSHIKHTVKLEEIVKPIVLRFKKSFEKKQEIKADQPVENIAEATKLAKKTLQRIAQEFITGSGSTVGVPDLRTGSVLELKGLGSLFNGRYFVTGTTHTINDSGYLVNFECRREDIFK